jgi:hypothetical protein
MKKRIEHARLKELATWSVPAYAEEAYQMAEELLEFRELQRQLLESDRTVDPNTNEDTTLEHVQYLCRTLISFN